MSVMADVAGAHSSRGKCDQHAIGSWVCTHHIEIYGTLVHVAGAHDCVVAVQFNKTMLDFSATHGRTLQWTDVRTILEEYIFEPPTADEVKEAAAATARLLREMETTPSHSDRNEQS